jgi:hypothetical protein
MVQGKAPKPRGGQKDKTAKKHRAAVKSHEGLIKTAVKPKGAKEKVRQDLKMQKKLTGAISSHIEQVMVKRIQSDRGATAPSQLKVVKQIEGYQTEKKKKRSRKEKQALKADKAEKLRMAKKSLS